jgi:hypothetical protein
MDLITAVIVVARAADALSKLTETSKAGITDAYQVLGGSRGL